MACDNLYTEIETQFRLGFRVQKGVDFSRGYVTFGFVMQHARPSMCRAIIPIPHHQACLKLARAFIVETLCDQMPDLLHLVIRP